MFKVATIVKNDGEKSKIYFDSHGKFSRIICGICNFCFVSKPDKDRFNEIMNRIYSGDVDRIGIRMNDSNHYVTGFKVDDYSVYIYSRNRDDAMKVVSNILHWSTT